MSALSDRLLILLIAVVGLGSIIFAWFGGLAEAELGGLTQLWAFVGLGVVLLIVLVGVWLEATHIDHEQERT